VINDKCKRENSKEERNLGKEKEVSTTIRKGRLTQKFNMDSIN
jgi:hypothetical protein